MSGALSKGDVKSVRVGVGVIVVKDKALLLGKRKGSHGSETWAPPGGHLEFGETPDECAKRELLEETGLEALKCVLGPRSNDYFQKENKHYITLFVFAKEFSGQPKVLEPEKCAEWRYFPISDLPHPLFLPLESMLSSGRLDLEASL